MQARSGYDALDVSRLKTARVPPSLEADFRKAEALVSRFFEERVEDPSHGTIEIAGERYVLVRAASLSVEFFGLVDKLYGPGREAEARAFARNILYDLAHAIGKSDARMFHQKLGLDEPIARISAGPIHFSHSGWAFVELDESADLSHPERLRLLYDHPYSFESDAWIRAGRETEFPVCIMNAGYSSGWCEESFGMPMVASEVLCRAKGDDQCRFIMARPEMIEQFVEEYIAGKPHLAARLSDYDIPDFFARKTMEEELRATRDELERRVVERTRALRQANEKLRLEMEERERILTRLQNTQRLESLGRLAGGVAHDFNNLLGVIMGYSSMLQGRVASDDPTYAMLAEITQAAQVAASLTKQLLTFSRAQATEHRRIDLNEVVRDVSNMLRRLVGDDVSVRNALDERPAYIEADPGQIEQMLMNLVVNARDAMPEGGSLRIDTALINADDPEGSPTHVRLSVADTGIGMDDSTQSKIFEPFFSTKEGGEGTGLGLSTVYGIVTRAGGTISVDSMPLLGACFDIVFPLADAGGEVSGAGQLVSHGRPRGETVLLVEDRIGFRAVMANLLNDAGYDVLVAHDTGDAVRIAQQHPGRIHVLLTDMIMPGMNGRELAERILQILPDVRVLFMSGYPDEIDGERQMGAAHRFIAKPFTPAELHAALRELIEG